MMIGEGISQVNCINDDDDDDSDAINNDLCQVDCAHDDRPAKGSPGLLTAARGQDSRAAAGCQEVHTWIQQIITNTNKHQQTLTNTTQRQQTLTNSNKHGAVNILSHISGPFL